MTTYNHHTIEEVLAAVERGQTKAGVARLLGVRRQTVYNYCKRWKSVEDAFEDKRGELVDLAEMALRKLIIAENVTAVTFTLKTLGKNEGYVERQEMTGANGGAVRITAVSELTDDELRVIAARGRERIALPPGGETKPD